MIKGRLLVCLGMTGVAALAQNNVPLGNMTREAIEIDRSQAKAMFDKQELECQKKFVVTDCLRQVDLRRREHADRLRQHENLLRDQERQQRALEATRAREQREAQRLQRDAEHRAQTSRPAREVSSDRSTPRASPMEPGVSEAVVQPPKPSGEQMARNRAAFEAKQKALEERRTAAAKRLRESSGASAPKALPIPP